MEELLIELVCTIGAEASTSSDEIVGPGAMFQASFPYAWMKVGYPPEISTI
jgi:hypothetical protein